MNSNRKDLYIEKSQFYNKKEKLKYDIRYIDDLNILLTIIGC